MKILLNLLLILAAASALAGTEPVTAEIPSSDGLKIHAESWGSGEPVIVFVHGWSCDRGYWSAQVKDLVGDYRVVTIDLAGHGQSAAGRKAYSIEAFGQDVAAVLSEWDLANVILVGHSMGGAVIAEAALAIEMGATAEDIAATIHPHPTLSETYQDVADMFGAGAVH